MMYYKDPWPDPNKLKKRYVAPAEYASLIQQFVEGRISAQEFETQYITLFYTFEGERPDELFLILNKLFCEVDAYWPGTFPDGPDEETFDSISAQTLRAFAAEALEKLQAFI